MKKTGKIILIVIGLLAVSTGVYGFSLYCSIKETFDQVYVPLETTKSAYREEEVSIVEQEPITILLFGVDEREGDKGRSDVLILLHVNPRTDSLLMLNIPRDTRTQLAQLEKEDKINHAYAFGGVQMTVETVENFLHVPVDYYICVNMVGFENVIDALGGVDVQNQMDFEYLGYNFTEGLVHMDGKMALAYSRMRYDDPEGDLGRNKRQQQVIKGILSKVSSGTMFSQVDEVLNEVSQSVKTNLTFQDVKELVAGYRTATDHIDTEKIDGEGQIIDGIYYYLVASEERQRIQSRIQSFLDMKTLPSS